MTMSRAIVAAAIAIAAAAVTFAIPAWAAPDPHIPNGEADWCPGGKPSGQGGQTYCLGVPFADGSFYAQTWSFGSLGPFAPGAWHEGATCSVWINGFIQHGLPGGRRPSCGGGPYLLK